MGDWKSPFGPPRPVDERTELERHLDAIAGDLTKPKPNAPTRDPEGIDADFTRGIFERQGDNPAVYGAFTELSVPPAVGSKPGLGQTAVPVDKRFDTFTVWNLAPYPSTQDFALGNLLTLRINETVSVPVFPGLQITTRGVETIHIRNFDPTTTYRLTYTFSRGAAVRPPTLLYGVSPVGGGNLQPARVTGNRLMVDADVSGSVPLDVVVSDVAPSKTPWRGQVAGTGAANNQLVYAPPGGATFEVCDVFATCPGTATYVRYLYKFGLGGSPFADRAGRPPADCPHSFGGGAVLSAGVELYVDVQQSGTASPWVVTARGFYY